MTEWSPPELLPRRQKRRGMMQERSFGEYRDHGHLWITLSNGDYYPDILVEACELYQQCWFILGSY